jgi:hypothetical protein
MAVQWSTVIRNAQLDAIESQVGASPKLRIYNGVEPANCAAALSGNTLLAEGALPADWMNDASTGSKTKLGTWSMTGQVGAGAGTSGTFWRLYDSAGTTCHGQGTLTITGGGGDMTVDNTNIANNQAVSISSFTVNAGNG